MKFYLIHHAHTDIGYTDRQEKIAWNHAKYLESVVEILREAEKGPKWAGFCWNVETFWMVEQFERWGRPEYAADFWRYVREGKIGLSGSYVNGTDLTDELVLRETLARCRQRAEAHGVKLRSAMTADINGCPWGFVSLLSEAGVGRLLSAVHTHHGHYTAGKKQMPFYWEGPDGRKLLVWQSEHYHLGNEINIHQLSSQYGYMIRDGLPNTGLSNWELSRRRLFAYAEELSREGFPFDFCPILVSGLCTDNSPPGPGVIEFVHRWNEENGDKLPLEMTTLDRFFDEVEQHAEIIPTYRGDWTDWWADGVGSTPDGVSHYREAARKFRACREMDPESAVVSPDLMDEARRNLMLYAEHTWGFSSSVSQPAHPMVNLLDMRKTLYAARANEAASLCLDALCAHWGETPVVTWKDYRLHAVNPNPAPVFTVARTALEILFGHQDFRIVKEGAGEEIPYQLERVARGWQFNLLVKLAPHEHAVYRLEENAPKAPPMIGMTCDYGADGVRDFAADRLKDPDWACTPFEIITPFLHIRWEVGKGIISVYDRRRGRELLSDPAEGAFTPIYEITPVRTNPCGERRAMGRNRKAPHTLRDFGVITDAKAEDFGPVMARVTLTYQVRGSESTQLVLTAYHDLPRLEVEYRLHKESRLEPENVYLALPFFREDAVLWADKTGCLFRPRLDQLPGSCADFYALQNGAAWIGEGSALLLETPDTPLFAMGPLSAHDIRLSGDPLMKNTDRAYAWVMNNFWETNFKASLGGFHSFRFALQLTEETDPAACFAVMRADNQGVVCFPSFDAPKGRQEAGF